jgi:formamidopyrimidine-DNA glycosylase
MPELPEVEVTRQSFATRITGATVTAVRVGKPLRWPLGCEPEALIGRSVAAVSRRGKYLWLQLDRGGLLMHLGMSGSLAFAAQAGAPSDHDHFDLVTTQGTLRLTDPRRFGAVVWAPAVHEGMAAKLLDGLGIEPFDQGFTGEHLYRLLRRRKVAIKTALVGGDVVVGAGNIYACEALYAAGIDPRTASSRLSRRRCEALAAALRLTLERALTLGGSTLRNFRDADGVSGEFQLQAEVYGREGEPCRRCGARVCRIVQGQRSTYFCSGCQRR